MLFPAVFYGFETWSFILTDKHGLRALENKVLRKILGPEGDEVTEEWKKLYSSSSPLPSGGFALTVALVRALIVCHIFSAAGHPVTNVTGSLKRKVTRNQQSSLLMESSFCSPRSIAITLTSHLHPLHQSSPVFMDLLRSLNYRGNTLS
jgi:hypothetical protein